MQVSCTPTQFLKLGEAARGRLAYASYYLRKYKLVYVETPKAACSALKHTMAALWGHDLARSYQSISAEKTNAMTIHDRGLLDIPNLCDLEIEEVSSILAREDVMRFCVVRNPFSRLTSAWSERILMRAISPQAAILNHVPFPQYRADLGYLRECFSQFVDYLYHQEMQIKSNHHWELQRNLLLPEVLDYRHVIKVENMDRELGPVVSHIENLNGIWPGVARLNEAPLKLGRNLYTPLIAKKVAEIYAIDFETYGYRDSLEISKSESSSALPVASWVRSIQQRNQRISILSRKLRTKVGLKPRH